MTTVSVVPNWRLIGPEMVAWMEDIRLLRSRVTQRAGYIRGLRRLDEALVRLRAEDVRLGIIPHAVNLAGDAGVRELVKNLPELVDPAQSASPPPSVYLTFAARLRLATITWQNRVALKLRDLVIGSSHFLRPASSPTSAVAILSLAQSVFRCKKCSAILRWPTIVSHSHMHHRRVRPVLPDNPAGHPRDEGIFGLTLRDDVYESAVVTHYGYEPWGPASLEFVGHNVLEVIRACGLDPNVATPAQIRAADVRLVCWACSRHGESMVVMDWTTAFAHCLDQHSAWEPRRLQQPHVAWTKLDNGLLASVQAVEASRRAAWYPTRVLYWQCAHCLYGCLEDKPYEAVDGHVQTRRPQAQHVRPRPDNPALSQAPVLLLSEGLQRANALNIWESMNFWPSVDDDMLRYAYVPM
ncbi:uncharacterized protein B0H18DRAFT_955923 [Fomitopsis serialis]|uniref:uncharacterized protein n=1 Tax=Fomitopsis serialis TaxID=139415 RepID=UPI0020072B09|nr:uncharacterized protein B0H18DRAFT_955923 [Neoantrodia serialis]KAH9923216.1 hypothetical protein B0H18DRAFT_955923 [Neoantrodia serialis]